VSVGEWPLHIILKLPYGDFRSETATWIQKWFKTPGINFRKPQITEFFKAGTAGVVIDLFWAILCC
jgi:hypothetical protein